MAEFLKGNQLNAELEKIFEAAEDQLILVSPFVTFERAVELDPETSRYSYVYAVALESLGRRDDAIGVLEITTQRHPWDRDVLVALVDYLMAAEDHVRARDYVEKLLAVDPGNPAALRLRERLPPAP